MLATEVLYSLHILLCVRTEVHTVTVNTPNGRAPPLVTGTFGSADFIHSLMGEATEYVIFFDEH